MDARPRVRATGDFLTFAHSHLSFSLARNQPSTLRNSFINPQTRHKEAQRHLHGHHHRAAVAPRLLHLQDQRGESRRNKSIFSHCQPAKYKRKADSPSSRNNRQIDTSSERSCRISSCYTVMPMMRRDSWVCLFTFCWEF